MHAPPLSLREHLRSAIAEVHDRVDAGVTARLGSDPEGYAAFLRSSFAVWQEFGPSLDRTAVGFGLSAIADDALRRLRRDLAQEGAAAPPTPPEHGVDAPSSLALGHAYALEGSALGAAAVRRELARHHPSAPHGFLDLQAELAPTRWPAFVARLEASDADPERAAAGAAEVFRRVLATLAEPPRA